uniref:Uncharacterized protein n=1 Tax=Arundo donax TaxID=35708 RepID=A0A0A8YKJ5_ARUDO
MPAHLHTLACMGQQR